MDIVAEGHTAPGAGSGSTAPMDIVEEDHTGRGAGPAPRDTQRGLFTGASGESQTPLLKGHCKFCHKDFQHPSFVAYVLLRRAGHALCETRGACGPEGISENSNEHFRRS